MASCQLAKSINRRAEEGFMAQEIKADAISSTSIKDAVCAPPISRQISSTASPHWSDDASFMAPFSTIPFLRRREFQRRFSCRRHAAARRPEPTAGNSVRLLAYATTFAVASGRRFIWLTTSVGAGRIVNDDDTTKNGDELRWRRFLSSICFNTMPL